MKGTKNAIVRLAYLQGICNFQSGFVRLELLPNEIIMTQGKTHSASLPYCKITDANAIRFEKLVKTSDYSNARLEGQTCLMIKYQSDNGDENQLLFEWRGAGDFNFFVRILRERVPSIPNSPPTHVNL